MKKIYKLLFLACFLVFMTGCMKMNSSVTIIDKDTAETTLTILMEEEFLDTYSQDSSSIDPFENLLEQYENMDAEIEEIEEEYDGETYVGYKITVHDEKQNKELLENYLEVEEKDGKEIYTLSMPLEEAYNQMNSQGYSGQDINSYTIKQMKNSGIEMSMSFTMPYPITEATAGEIEGDTVTIDILELLTDEVEEIKITSEEGSSSNSDILLYIAIGIIVVASGSIATIVIRNKKKLASQNTTENTTKDITEENQTVTDSSIEEPIEETTSEETIEDTTNITTEENKTIVEESPSNDIIENTAEDITEENQTTEESGTEEPTDEITDNTTEETENKE